MGSFRIASAAPILLVHPQNENVPDSMSHGTLVEQPSPEVCSPPTYRLGRGLGMARTGHGIDLPLTLMTRLCPHIGRITPNPGFFPMQQIGKHRRIGDVGRRSGLHRAGFFG